MQYLSLHPVDPALVRQFVDVVLVPDHPAMADMTAIATVDLNRVREAVRPAAAGSEAAAGVISHALGVELAARYPSFVGDGLSLSVLEATIDRGIGMLMRPPSRLFEAAGLSQAAARAMPIRLDATASMMGGAWIPAHLVPRLGELLVSRQERLLPRIDDAGHDAIAWYGLLTELAAFAGERGLGIYEAIDVVMPDAPAANPPGTVIVAADRRRMDRQEVKRLQAVMVPPKRGLISRLLGGRDGTPMDSR